MNQLGRLLGLLFKRVSSQQVLEGHVTYDSFDKKEFLRMAVAYMPEYSENETENMFHHYIDDFRKDQNLWDGTSQLNVFDVLFYYVKQCLVMQENEVVCRYDRLGYWRNMTIELEEEILVPAYFAQIFHEEAMLRHGFAWKRVIGHNNIQLNQFLQRGISENHFHLMGSGPIFQISWLSLMNNVISSKLIEHLKQYDVERRYSNRKYSQSYREISFYHRYLQAALIRLFLFSQVTGKRIQLGKYVVTPASFLRLLKLEKILQYDKLVLEIDKNNIINILSKKGIYITSYDAVAIILKNSKFVNEKHDKYKEVCTSLLSFFNRTRLAALVLRKDRIFYMLKHVDGNIDITQLVEEIIRCLPEVNLVGIPSVFLDLNRYNQTWNQITWKNVKWLLSNPEQIEYYLEDLQSNIDSFRFLVDKSEIAQNQEMDYLLQQVYFVNAKDKDTVIFTGERWICYKLLHAIYNENTEYKEYFNLFYAYILIKESIRSEIVQCNENVGFHNFEVYQGRKLDLLEDEIYKNALASCALRESLITEKVRTIEIRITPAETVKLLRKQIMDLDSIIDPKAKYVHQFFYTLHFIKVADENVPMDFLEGLECRHAKLRWKVHNQAEAILTLRRYYPKIATRILGIDAASNEIVCRPEVFAIIFRRLKKNIVNYEEYDGIKSLPQLRITYHVGEDFLDIADGLRAIDEAILYLGMDCGDRLGHAMVLGIDIRDWYRSKNYTISLSKQDYLDDIVWIYYKLVEYHIEGFENLKDLLLSEYSKFFGEIYRTHMDVEELNYIIKQNRRKNAVTDNIVQFDFSIHNYYKAWHIRGDNPKLYKMGYFDERMYMEMEDEEVLSENRDRLIPEVAILYYYYHYNAAVRQEGGKIVSGNVPRFLIDALSKIQKKMQMDIGRKGIGIETNPSSNCMIGTFREYAKHPILNFYNKSIEGNAERVQECAQLTVSINTDDQGVFSTSLENEYAMMAFAMEKAKDKNGNYLYQRSGIYKWLDDIRVMGNEQSFGFAIYEEEMKKRNKS